jgi:GNAT superfamily N-acetyltransferase
VKIHSLTSNDVTAELASLSALLENCVAGGASIGFLWPMSDGEAAAYWRTVVGPVAVRSRVVLVARDDAGAIVGTGQLDLATRANGLHRAEVMKLMVLASARRQGIARALMLALEAEARRHHRTTLHLDTNDGDGAELFYQSLGWTYIGGIPEYAPGTDGTLRKNAIYYKLLT